MTADVREHSAEDWRSRMLVMLGKRVKVTLDFDDPAICTGKLLSFCEDGEIVILDDMGMKHWCWPNLRTELEAADARSNSAQP